MNNLIQRLYQIRKTIVKMLIARGYMCHSSLSEETLEKFQENFKS